MANVYEIVTNRIIEQLEAGVAPWHKPWTDRGRSALPKNLISGREYRGINFWILMSSDFRSPYWLTFRQAVSLGGSVRKGSHGLPVVFWKFGTREVQDGDEIVDKPTVLCRYYTVFNLEQCDNIASPSIETPSVPETSPIQACEDIVSGWTGRPRIEHGGDRASYHKLEDCVRMPARQSFDLSEEYYSTLFHELTHATGHPTRLKRSTLMDTEFFGDQNYGREELVAEMGAAYLCGITGITNQTVCSSASYLQCWLNALGH